MTKLASRTLDHRAIPRAATLSRPISTPCAASTSPKTSPHGPLASDPRPPSEEKPSGTSWTPLWLPPCSGPPPSGCCRTRRLSVRYSSRWPYATSGSIARPNGPPYSTNETTPVWRPTPSSSDPTDPGSPPRSSSTPPQGHRQGGQDPASPQGQDDPPARGQPGRCDGDYPHRSRLPPPRRRAGRPRHRSRTLTRALFGL